MFQSKSTTAPTFYTLPCKNYRNIYVKYFIVLRILHNHPNNCNNNNNNNNNNTKLLFRFTEMKTIHHILLKNFFL
jgi:hypothetical protein